MRLKIAVSAVRLRPWAPSTYFNKIKTVEATAPALLKSMLGRSVHASFSALRRAPSPLFTVQTPFGQPDRLAVLRMICEKQPGRYRLYLPSSRITDPTQFRFGTNGSSAKASE